MTQSLLLEQVVRAIDALNQLQYEKVLLEMAVEQLQLPTELNIDRADVLSTHFLSMLECCTDDIKIALTNVEIYISGCGCEK
jgi:hypothetical protein